MPETEEDVFVKSQSRVELVYIYAKANLFESPSFVWEL